MTRKIPKPFVIAFELTQKCPLKCAHCRASAAEQKDDYLDTTQCEKIIKSIADYKRCILIMTGGEPMCRDDIYHLIIYARRLGLRVVMATCGIYINDESIAKLQDSGLMAISFSIDGATAETHDAFRNTKGAFDTVLTAIEKSKKVGIRFQINTTVTKRNIDEIPAIAEMAEKLGAFCFNPFILVPVGRADQIRDLILSPDNYETLLVDMAEMKKKSHIDFRLTCGPQFARICRQRGLTGSDRVPGCLAATDFAFISCKGDIQTCGFFDISAGNLVENDYNFAAIWEKSDFLNSLRDYSGYKGPCGACSYVQICRGCRARAFTMLGDYLESDPICKIVSGREVK